MEIQQLLRDRGDRAKAHLTGQQLAHPEGGEPHGDLLARIGINLSDLSHGECRQ
jgi:hypothetical protein